MRIAYLTSDLGVPVLGTKGCSIHVREIVSAMRDLGHEVRIYTPDPGGDDGAAEEAGVLPLRMNGFADRASRLLGEERIGVSSHLFREVRRLLYSEQLKSRLLPLLEEFRPQAVYERYTLFGYAGVELARELRVPLLLEVNAPLAEEGVRRRGWVLGRTAAAMEGEILRGADAVLAVSEAVAAHARRLGVPPERVFHVPNGVDPSRFHPGVSGDAVRRRLGLVGKTVVGYVGSLRAWHDLDTVLEAIERVAAVDAQVHFLAVGPGADRAALEARGGGRVTCSGAVPHARVPEYLAAADVAIVPFGGRESYFSPLKLFESMAMGKPVVAARMGQVTDFITPDESGLLYEPGDAADLACCIGNVLARPDRGAGLGAAARRRVADEHTWSSRAEKIVNIARSGHAVA